MYENKSYRNNSVILIHNCDHCSYPHPVISCVTDNSSFYKQTDGYSYSDWYYPSGKRIPDFNYLYRNNIPFQHYCFLRYHHSLRPSVISPVYTGGGSFTGSENCSGLYRCLIPDRNGELQELFLGIYIDNICKCL